MRNSFVGEVSAAAAAAAAAVASGAADDGLLGVSIGPAAATAAASAAGMRFPFTLASARGSIDLRRRWPPRGIIDVSTAYSVSSSHLSSRSQLSCMN